MRSTAAVTSSLWQRRLSAALGLYALVGGVVSLCGWVFDVPRLTDWFDDGVSIQPNTAVLIALAGAALLMLQGGPRSLPLGLGGVVAVMGGLNLLQYILGVDFGFSHQLLFGRSWGQEATVTPGRFGPPASISFMLIGAGLLLLSQRNAVWRRCVPSMALVVGLLMLFSLLGYLFDAQNFMRSRGCRPSRCRLRPC